MRSTTNAQWLLSRRPNGRLTEENFEWRNASLPEIEDGQLLVRNIYLSMDPASRGWTAGETYMSAIQIGEVMRSTGIGVVEQSRSDRYNVGDIVIGLLGWQQYYIGSGHGLYKAPPLPIPLTGHFGLMGHIGMTAYFGLLDIADPQPGETLVVSAAAGAVGSLVGQIGKIKGCHVVGIAGSDEKIEWITEDLGFDAGINYKTEDVYSALKNHCPNGIDIYFENVGGKILEAVLAQINDFARIPLCGMISQYNATEAQPGPRNLVNMVMRRAKMQGFIVTDYFERANEAVTQLAMWYGEGKLQYRVHVEQGLANAPQVLNMLFDGKNRGKLVLQVSEDPTE